MFRFFLFLDHSVWGLQLTTSYSYYTAAKSENTALEHVVYKSQINVHHVHIKSSVNE